MKSTPLKRIAKYHGLYGERALQPDTEYVYSELLQTRSRHFDWDIRPHVHPRLYQLFLIEDGSFEFYEASTRRELKGPCVLLIPPTALHGFAYKNNTKGRILTLSDSVLEQARSAVEVITPMLQQVQYFTDFNEEQSFRRFQLLMEAIDEELYNELAEKRLMVNACLQQLFLILYRLWQHTKATNIEADNKALSYYRKFQQSIRQKDSTLSITQMARELAITPVHLNRICRSIAGKSASELIQEYQLEEARKYLLYTSYSVSEIAYLLHFEYPNYFARFFKKHSGQSPTEFRKGKV